REHACPFGTVVAHLPCSVSKKPQDSVALYQHRLRVDDHSIRKLQEVIATVEALKQQRASSTDDE
ncbi:MAG TPA: hypothetical protein VGC42_20800, partial [Kofleriaceae bacterium]